PEKRLLFVPDANLFVALTPDCEKIHVFPIDIESALDKAGVDYLFTTSRPPAAVQGEQFQYVIQVRSKKGGIRCKLEAGPDGMKVEPEGVVDVEHPRRQHRRAKRPHHDSGRVRAGDFPRLQVDACRKRGVGTQYSAPRSKATMMSTFTPAENTACRRLVELGL